jgi:macrolide phosphotransferase
VDPGGRITGIIDWTEAEVSDPAIDFVFVYWIFGEPMLRQLLKRYLAAGGRVWPGRVQQIGARQSIIPATVAVFAQDSGQTQYLEFARLLLAAQEAELQA